MQGCAHRAAHTQSHTLHRAAHTQACRVTTAKRQLSNAGGLTGFPILYTEEKNRQQVSPEDDVPVPPHTGHMRLPCLADRKADFGPSPPGVPPLRTQKALWSSWELETLGSAPPLKTQTRSGPGPLLGSVSMRPATLIAVAQSSHETLMLHYGS
jgi:hypothetical protein